MTTVAIELVDAGLTALRDEALTAPSPGVALLDPAGVVVGRAAAAAQRLKPVLATDLFWTDLSTEPLARTVPGVRSSADLAFLHLSQLWREVGAAGDEAIFAVPGSMRGPALGLAAGIARAAGIVAAGWVDCAVAACAGLAARETVLHLDVQLHQSVLTVLEGADLLRRRRVEVAPRAGLKALQSAWAQLVAETMVRRTRFDPLHQATTEQQLFDRMPGWLAALAGAEDIEVLVEGGAGAFGVTLPREQFAFAAEAWYSQLIELLHGARSAGEPVTVALSARAASLPGFAARCSELAEAEILELPEGAAARGAQAMIEAIRGGAQPELVNALRRTKPVPRRAQSRAAGGESPTHVLFAGRALAITAEPLVVGLAPAAPRMLALPAAAGVSRRHCELAREGGTVVVRDLSRYGTYVNGERVTGSFALAAGDQLRLGRPGITLELVAVGHG